MRGLFGLVGLIFIFIALLVVALVDGVVQAVRDEPQPPTRWE